MSLYTGSIAAIAATEIGLRPCCRHDPGASIFKFLRVAGGSASWMDSSRRRSSKFFLHFFARKKKLCSRSALPRSGPRHKCIEFLGSFWTDFSKFVWSCQ